MVSNEQWGIVKDVLKGFVSDIDFTLEDKKISIRRKFISENKMAYVVYIDDIIKPTWGDPEHKDFKPIVEQIWHKKTKLLYRPSEVKKMVRIYGKRRLKKEFPNIDKRVVKYFPFFERYSVLEKKFKRIKNLKLYSKEVSNDKQTKSL